MPRTHTQQSIQNIFETILFLFYIHNKAYDLFLFCYLFYSLFCQYLIFFYCVALIPLHFQCVHQHVMIVISTYAYAAVFMRAKAGILCFSELLTDFLEILYFECLNSQQIIQRMYTTYLIILFLSLKIDIMLILQIMLGMIHNIIYLLFLSFVQQIHKMTDKPDLSWIEKDVGCWIYSPQQQIGPIFTKGVIKYINKLNNKVTCALENGSQVQTSGINLEKRRLSNSIERDLITLQIINGAEILYQLKKRLEQQKIHTYLWNSLLIINPFVKIQGMYDQSIMKSYYEKVGIQKKTLNQVQPHIYAFVCNIVNNMKVSEKIQMISISGESGSGKTQTNKQCLRIISYMCEGHLKKTEAIPSYLIQQRILNCDSVLQCFGNAKTSKNDNSSRFGKLVTELINSKEMQIIKCQVKVFFLQKSRIIHQSNSERNFHIFYQLIAHCPQNMRSHLGLKTKDGQVLQVHDFTYLTSNKNNNLKEQDQNMWNSLLNSFKLLDINQTQKQNIFQIVAAILHLGNIQFNHATLNDKDPCQINEIYLPLISRLLMISPAQLKELLLYDLKQMPNKQKYFGPMSQRECQQGRDSLAKILYENLFQWIVQQLNKKVNENHKPQNHIKIIKMLDIYGFQVFENNSFEQLCVNYTNQRIHQIYLDQVFKHEMAQLKKQGLENSIPKLKFTDNSKIIQILESSPNSVFNLLDQTCMFSIKDQQVSSKVNNMLKDHYNYSFGSAFAIKKNNFVFTIKHTPGEIQYNSMGFISKNKDLVRKFIADKLSKSKSVIIGQKFTQLLQSMQGISKNKRYLSKKIINQVSYLITQMNSNSDMHFIRCIKPNQTKSALNFVERVCYQQIKHLGVLDTVRMRKDSYHVRLLYRDFYKKYGILSGNVSPLIGLSQGKYSNQQCKEMTKNLISSKFRGANIDYLYGEQKFFMKMDTNNYFQAILKQKTKNIVYNSTIIKVAFRHYHKRDERSYLANQARLIQKKLREYLRDIIKIKRMNAAKKIWNFWVQNCDSYFKRKRRIPLMAIQKYIKKITTKKYCESKHKYMLYAKNMINSMGSVEQLATKFENHNSVKQQLVGDIFDSIWNKMQKHYTQTLQTYFKTGSVILRNRIKVISANDKSHNRLIIKNNLVLQKYFKAVHWAKLYQKTHNQIVKVQKCIKMATMRRNYNKLKSNVVKIQRAWRNYKYQKQHNQDFTTHYFGQHYEMEKEWKTLLHRNLKMNNFALFNNGMEKILEKFQNIKKNKIILFYYLIDVEIFVKDPSINNWVENYLYLTEESLLKLNPVQYVDVANTHTVASTTSKVYSWGSIEQNPVIQQCQTNPGKIYKINADDFVTRIDSINPSSQQFLVMGNEKKNQKDQNTNKQWFSLEHNFVLLNGIVLTMQNISFTKISMPQKIAQIACGFTHVICRSILKKVYTWGKNKNGQLGTGDYFQTNSMDPKHIQYFIKKRIPVCQVAASPQCSIVMDSNNKVYWFGSNGTIKNVCFPLQFNLSSKSIFLANQNKYTPIRIISRWSKTISLIGLTIACHDDVLKNQISMRKKVLENLMNKWNEDISTINPPYSQSVADHISERHMPLPVSNELGSNTQRTLTNRQIRQKIINDIHKIEQAERELLRTRKIEPKIEKRKKY